MAKKKLSSIERFIALSDQEKAAEFAKIERFNREFPLPMKSGGPLPGKALTPAQRRLWTKVKRTLPRGRPTIGQGSKVVPVSIERGLLKQADAFARQHKLKRSQMFAQALQLLMTRAKAS